MPRTRLGEGSRWDKHFPPDEPGKELDDDARIWSVYAKRAEEMDTEMLREWNGTLDTLLIFVSG